MDEQTAAWVQTWLDEPELLREAGQPAPVFTAAEIAEARMLCASVEAGFATLH